MDTERKEMCEHHLQSEDEATITSILGTVFPAEKEKETTSMAFSAKLDEEEFEPLVEEGELPSIPTGRRVDQIPGIGIFWLGSASYCKENG